MTIRHLTTFDAVLAELGGLRGIAGLVGVSKPAVSQQRRRGRFPARWFDVVDEEVRRRGMTVSRSVFDFSVPCRREGEPVG